MSLPDVFDSIRRPDDLGRCFLPFRRPHRQSSQKSAIGDFELEEGIGYIAAGLLLSL